jgi:hypothetical protein
MEEPIKKDTSEEGEDSTSKNRHENAQDPTLDQISPREKGKEKKDNKEKKKIKIPRRKNPDEGI